MTLHLHTPSSRLTPFVQLLWLMEAGCPEHEKERVLPDGCMELVVNLKEDRIPVYDPRDPLRVESRNGAVICGPHSEFMVIDREPQARVTCGPTRSEAFLWPPDLAACQASFTIQ